MSSTCRESISCSSGAYRQKKGLCDSSHSPYNLSALFNFSSSLFTFIIRYDRPYIVQYLFPLDRIFQSVLDQSDDQFLHLQDRKSTRLNSSHVSISYAVFCLKKNKHSIATYYRF